MNPDRRHPILYASVSHGPIVIADLLLPPTDPNLAAGCLAAAPPHHLLFTHTAGGHIHAFLMADPFIFFAISDDSLGCAQTLRLLHRLHDAFSSLSVPDSLSPRCLQDEFLPVIRDLVSSIRFPEEKPSPPPPLPLAAAAETGDKEGMVKKEKKKRRRKESPMSESRTAILVSDDDVSGAEWKQATRAWRRQVRLVLVVDLVVCCLLFGIWLSVCRGFQCMAS